MLQGVGEQIASRHIPKIFLVNGSHDRETTAMPSVLDDLPPLAAASAPRLDCLPPRFPYDGSAQHEYSNGAMQGSQNSTGAASHRLLVHTQSQATAPAEAPAAWPAPASSQCNSSGWHNTANSSSGTRSSSQFTQPLDDSHTHMGSDSSQANDSGSSHAAVQPNGDRFKHLRLDSSSGRTSRPHQPHGARYMKASDMVLAISDALNRTHAPAGPSSLSNTPAAYVNALIAPEGGAVDLDCHELHQLGIRY